MKINTVFVVGCGESAKDWFKTPYDYSVGVNDCIKFGQHPNTLILVNAPHKFQPTKDNGYQDRISVIKSTKPQEVITNSRNLWAKYFNCNVEEVRTQSFIKPEWFKKGNHYHSKTSTFIALNYAFNLGAEKIVLWGVDLVKHPHFPVGDRETDYEIGQYAKLISAIQRQGTEIFIGNENTVLNRFLKVYKP